MALRPTQTPAADGPRIAQIIRGGEEDEMAAETKPASKSSFDKIDAVYGAGP